MDFPADRHPGTGLRYVHVVDETDATLHDVHRAVTRLAGVRSWMSVLPMSACVPERRIWEDPSLAFVFWREFPSKLQMPNRRCATALHLCEPRPNEWFPATSDRYDVVFAHTVVVAERVKKLHHNVAFAPTGYDPETMGRPDWDVPKAHSVVSYGNLSERRRAVVGWFRKILGAKFLHSDQLFTDYRRSTLDHASANLYIQQASGAAFSQFRIWQAIAGSAALVVESQLLDTWPAVPGRDYVQVPPLDSERSVAEALEILRSEDLGHVARTAHANLSAWTFERCLEEFTYPRLRRNA